MSGTQHAGRLEAMATPSPGEPDTIEHEAIRRAIEQIQAAATPGPDVSRLEAEIERPGELNLLLNRGVVERRPGSCG